MPPDLTFTTRTILECVPERGTESRSGDQEPCFHLGLIESSVIGKLRVRLQLLSTRTADNEQIVWWKDLLLHGMREFFYVNRIDFTAPDFVELTASDERPLEPRTSR